MKLYPSNDKLCEWMDGLLGELGLVGIECSGQRCHVICKYIPDNPTTRQHPTAPDSTRQTRQVGTPRLSPTRPDTTRHSPTHDSPTAPRQPPTATRQDPTTRQPGLKASPHHLLQQLGCVKVGDSAW